MLKKKKKSKKRILMLISLVSLIVTAIIIGFFVSKKINSRPTTNRVQITGEKVPNNDSSEGTTDSFFPKKLNLENIYSQVRIKNGKAYFRERLVSFVFNDVIKNGSFVNGNLKYWYSFANDQKVFEINFEWKSSSGEKQTKVYRIEILI